MENLLSLKSILVCLLLISLIGTFKPVFFNEGSSMFKYVEKKQMMAAVQEEEVEEYMTDYLYGDGIETSSVEFETVENEDIYDSNLSLYDKIVAGILLVCSAFLLYPKFRESWLMHSLLLITLWLFLESIAVSLNGGKKFAEFAPLGHAVRWGLPLGIWALLFLKSENTEKYVKHCFAVCVALTFGIHGWEALNHNPPFKDLFFGTASTFGISVSSATVETLLTVIGFMDIALAVTVLFYRHTYVLMWMCFWGFATALSRPLSMGLEVWPETALRIANGGVPLVLYLIYAQSRATVDNDVKNTEALSA